jgi:hypothetical protein
VKTSTRGCIYPYFECKTGQLSVHPKLYGMEKWPNLKLTVNDLIANKKTSLIKPENYVTPDIGLCMKLKEYKELEKQDWILENQ